LKGAASDAPLRNDSMCGHQLRPVAHFMCAPKARSTCGERRSYAALAVVI